MEAIRRGRSAAVSPSCLGMRLRAALRPCRRVGATILLTAALALLSAATGLVDAAPAGATNQSAAVSNASNATDPKVTLFSDDFEGAWLWHASGGWAITALKSNGGTHSARGWAGQPSFASMSAGPFDLSDATQATLEFDLYRDLGTGVFAPGYGGTADGSILSFPGETTETGSSGGNWGHRQFSLSALLGNPHVWIAFDVANIPYGYLEGAYVDNVVLWATIPDTTPPTTTASGCDDAWHNTPVTVSFSASDNSPGSGVAYTEYQVDSAASWTTGASVTIAASSDGRHTVSYRSVDNVGNTEATQSATVKIDSRRPTTKAFRATVNKGKKVKLAYQVIDATPGCGEATVTLKVFKGKKLKKSIKVPGTPACNVKKTYSWRCTLAKGKYTIKVYATDIAGNAQSKVGSARLTVR